MDERTRAQRLSEGPASTQLNFFRILALVFLGPIQDATKNIFSAPTLAACTAAYRFGGQSASRCIADAVIASGDAPKSVRGH